MKMTPKPSPAGPIDIAAIEAEARRLRAEALAEMVRAIGYGLKRGWSALAHRSAGHHPAH